MRRLYFSRDGENRTVSTGAEAQARSAAASASRCSSTSSACRAEIELDEHDAHCVHALAYIDGQAGRHRTAVAGRPYRPHGGAQGVARTRRRAARMLRALIERARAARRPRGAAVRAGRMRSASIAPTGFEPEGPVYEEAGIPHQAMRRVFVAGSVELVNAASRRRRRRARTCARRSACACRRAGRSSSACRIAGSRSSPWSTRLKRASTAGGVLGRHGS